MTGGGLFAAGVRRRDSLRKESWNLNAMHSEILNLAMTHYSMHGFSWILAAPSPTSGTDAPPWWANSALIFPVAIGVMLLLMMNKGGRGSKDKVQAELLKNLKRGDRIQTIGGVLGTVNEVRDNEVVVKVDETSNIKMRFTREAIRRVVVDDEKAVEAKK
jgi:preprotein translocase subunit YajC